MILVTGGAGFIGANFVIDWLAGGGEPVLNLDKLTYAGNLANLDSVKNDSRHIFVRADIGDRATVAALLAQYKPRAIINFAAESHVDRSIDGAGDFMQTNLLGTFNLLETVRVYWEALLEAEKTGFRFLHVSTDEVYGSLGVDEPAFTEDSIYHPNSPYAASKAGSDHLVRAWHHTYGLPVLTTHCSNNYGPFQFPEKLIPRVILNALEGKPLPVYGDGENVRDWLHVADHCSAIRNVLARGTPGEVYNIGGNAEHANIDVVKMICSVLDDLVSPANGQPREKLITFIKDRPGHDRRYAINAGKMRNTLNWIPATEFIGGIKSTVRWYLDHPQWIADVKSGARKDCPGSAHKGRMP